MANLIVSFDTATSNPIYVVDNSYGYITNTTAYIMGSPITFYKDYQTQFTLPSNADSLYLTINKTSDYTNDLYYSINGGTVNKFSSLVGNNYFTKAGENFSSGTYNITFSVAYGDLKLDVNGQNTVQSVPEPSALILGFCCAIGVLWKSRRKNASS